MVAIGKVCGQSLGMWAGVFTGLSPRLLVTQDTDGARKRIRVGVLKTGVRADSPLHPPCPCIELQRVQEF